MTKRPNWSVPLARPVQVRDGPTLRTLKDAADYALQQPETNQPWQHVAAALMEAAQSGETADVTATIERVLWHRGKWVFPSH